MDHSDKTPREEFTSALQECVEENEWKYAGFTSDIYYALFGKGANELKNIMGANPHESAKEAMPPYMRLLAEKMEAEFAAALRNKFAEKGCTLTMDEALDVLIALETNDFWGKIIFKKTYKPDHNAVPGHKAPEPISSIESDPHFLDDNAEYIQETWLEDFSDEEDPVEIEPDESEAQAVIDNCLETIKACQETIETYEKTIEIYQAMIEERSNPPLEQEEKPISKLESTHSDYEAPKWEPSFWEKAGGFWDQFMETLGPGGLLFILALIGVWILKVFW